MTIVRRCCGPLYVDLQVAELTNVDDVKGFIPFVKQSSSIKCIQLTLGIGKAENEANTTFS